ncbi:hypothetical protein [Conexibacter sp. SYSU D00693]|uniref:hypothetical protein n=1 Tax=Conexibacter sp. SYSU D00693 TaxID=2812560 RepID=UPI00196B86ED|nr:hypothetical protein [Conexibacter sp. SYSU D00693]
MPQRTLVKSPPELWAEISDEAALGRHLEPLGEIRITRTEPETTVAWEGDRVRGTVALEPSGWGTKVSIDAEVEAEPAVEAPDPRPAPRRSFFQRLLRRPLPEPEPAPLPERAGPSVEDVEPVLVEVLDALGAANRRPFSRG